MSEEQKVESVTSEQESSASVETSSKFESKPEESKFQKAESSEDKDRYKRDMLRYKQDLAELREDVKNRDIDEERAKGNLEGVLESLKKENQDLKQGALKDRVSFASSQIEGEVKRIATERGCKDVDAFYRLIDKDQLSLVELDSQTFRASTKDAADLVEASMKRFEHIGLFGAKTVRIADATPGARPQVKEQPKTESEHISNYMKSKGWT